MCIHIVHPHPGQSPKLATTTKLDLDYLEERIKHVLETPHLLSDAEAKVYQLIGQNRLSKGQREKFLFRLRESSLLSPLPIGWSKTSKPKSVVCSKSSLDPLVLGLVISPKSYYCYLSALHLLGHLNKLPEQLDLAFERKNYSKSTFTSLSPNELESEFRKLPRVSTRSARYANHTFRLLEREATGKIGIIMCKSPFSNSPVPVTSIERTLIDSAVSPHYMGGFKAVQSVWTNITEEDIQIDKLCELYEAMSFRYPYWQRIGLLLELTGKNKSADHWMSSFGAPQSIFYADKPVQDSWIQCDRWKIRYPMS